MSTKEDTMMSHYVRMVKELKKNGMAHEKARNYVVNSYGLDDHKAGELDQKLGALS